VADKGGISLSRIQSRKPAVTVVVVNYNGRQVLPLVLNSLDSQTFTDFEIVVVDNGSKDDSIRFIQENYQWVKIKRNPSNYGYAHGLNDGISRSSGRYLLMLNNDIELDRCALFYLAKFLDDHPNVGVVQPKIISLQNKGFFDYAGAAGGEIDTLGYPFCRGRILETLEQDNGQYDDPSQIFWAGGAAFMVRRDVLERVGSFDEDFVIYHEETDFCWRVNLAGLKVAFEPSAKVYHHGSYTFGNLRDNVRFFYMHRNSFYLLMKYQPIRRLPVVLPARCLFEFFNILYALSKRRSSEAIMIIRGIMSALRNIRVTLTKRKIIECFLEKPYQKLPIYPRFVVVDYFLLRKKTFTQLVRNYPRLS
jgi:GT2 family glycosyltransferase